MAQGSPKYPSSVPPWDPQMLLNSSCPFIGTGEGALRQMEAVLSHRETVVRRRHWACVSYGNKCCTEACVLSPQVERTCAGVGGLVQDIVRRQWCCMYFLGANVYCWEFFKDGMCFEKKICIFKNLKILQVRNIRIAYFHLFRRIKEVSHTCFSRCLYCYCLGHCRVTEEPKYDTNIGDTHPRSFRSRAPFVLVSAPVSANNCRCLD